MSRVYQRAGKWYVDFTDASGKRIRKSVGRSRRQADEVLRKLDLGLAADAMGLETGKVGRLRLSAKGLFEKWLETYSRRNKKSWQHDEKNFRKHVVPVVGEMAAEDVTRREMGQILDAMVDLGLSGSTRRQVYQLVGQTFRWGIEQGLVEHDPTLGVRKPKADEKPVDDYLTRSEAARLLIVSPRGEREMYAMAVYAGLRRGELCAIRWSDIDFENNLIYVKKSHDDPRPKSKKARVVKLHPELKEILTKWRLKCPETPEELCFPNPVWVEGARDAKPRRSRFADYGFRKNLKQAGITRHVTFHTLRHTASSLLIMAGASREAVQDALGHSSPLVTERYIHLSKQFIQEEVSKLSLALPEREAVEMKLVSGGGEVAFEGADESPRRHKSGTVEGSGGGSSGGDDPQGGDNEGNFRIAGMAKLVDARDLKGYYSTLSCLSLLPFLPWLPREAG
jgi:integrase